MKCPVCQELLTMSERQGIEIDFCPACRGVWLDRGELDKILEREARVAGHAVASRPRIGGRDDDDEDDRYPRRRSMWRELFD
jgi:Zn-finger nucleic acid-binding protein